MKLRGKKEYTLTFFRSEYNYRCYLRISIIAKRIFEKIQPLFMIKNPPESKHSRNVPQYNKSNVQQTHSKHYPQGQKIESISSKIKNKTRVPTLTTTIQHSFGCPSDSNQKKKK